MAGEERTLTLSRLSARPKLPQEPKVFGVGFVRDVEDIANDGNCAQEYV